MDWLSELNPQQREAVTAPPGPILVLAGPGSGKTRVLTHRIAYLIGEGLADPPSLLAVTFTNKAAREMIGRVEHLLVADPAGHKLRAGLTLGTFHAFCARLIRLEADHLPYARDFVIFDEDDQRTIIRQALKDFNLDPKQVQPGRVHHAISQAKNELITAEEYPSGNYFQEIVRRVYARYQATLLANNALDFDDLLLWAVRLFEEKPQVLNRYRRRYAHLLVDEFQDTNTAQYLLLRLLGGKQPHLFVVGDPDQSIYGWRGADYRNVHRFQEDYPSARTILLEQNYRSTQTILDIAMAVINRAPRRQVKRLFTERGRGSLAILHEAYDEYEEAAAAVDIIATLTARGAAQPADCAIMYRTNAQSRLLEEAFLRAGLPYRLVGAQRFYGRREIKDLIAYLRLIHNPADQVSLLRVLNTPPRGIGAKTVQILLGLSQRHSLEPAQVLLEMARGEDSRFAAEIDARARRALVPFGRSLHRWLQAKQTLDVVGLMDLVLEETAFESHLDDGTDEGLQRIENVQELRRAAQDLDAMELATFLERVALVSDQDTLTDSLNAPTLLTLHAAKGLEFPVVIIVGLDDGLLPHQRSFQDSEAMAEERRLFYVGITRAQDRLYLLRAFRRRVAGESLPGEPSRFLEDIPAELLEGDLAGLQSWERRSYQRRTAWQSTFEPPRQARYRPGMRVRHESFGEGIVLQTSLHHDDEELVIEFERDGVKHLAASLAKLDVLDG